MLYVWIIRELSAAFYAHAVRRANRLTLAFARHFPAFERLRSTRSLASFVRNVYEYALFALAPHPLQKRIHEFL